MAVLCTTSLVYEKDCGGLLHLVLTNKLCQVMLGQGTLRPDLIESASALATVGGAEASCIKTHHNDTNLVRELRAAGKVKKVHLSLY